MLTSRLKPRVRLNELDEESFPRFVLRTLERSYPGLTEYGPSKDGGIDLMYQSSSGQRTIFQCKFSANPRSEWKKEQVKLRKKLALTRDGALASEIQFSPWANHSTPITTYVFCYSKLYSSRGSQDSETKHLRAKLEHFFQGEIGRREGFAHLHSINIEILCGNDLCALCEQQPLLCFNLFGPELPPGVSRVRTLGAAENEGAQFYDYLRNRYLKYYSRSEFKNDYREDAHGLRDENELIDLIFRKNASEPGLIITGPGGYGKSRLSRELCLLAEDHRQCLAFRLNEDATPDNVKDLIQLVPESIEVLLWVEYLETQISFDAIWRDLITRNQEGLIVRLIANCRTSYFKREAVDRYITVVDISPSAASRSTDAYRRAVFLHILKRAGFDAAALADEYGYNPALAAFILYLVNEGENDRSLAPDLTALFQEPEYQRDFGIWLIKRLHRSARVEEPELSISGLISSIAPLLAIFPVYDVVLTSIVREPRLRRLIEILAHDHLIEKRDQPFRPANRTPYARWYAIHDIIVDYLLIRFMTSSALRNQAVEDLFTLAEQHDLVSVALINVERVADDPAIVDTDWFAYIGAKLEARSRPWLGAIDGIARTSLMAPDAKLKLIVKYHDIFKSSAGTKTLDRIFASVAYSFSKWRALNRAAGYDRALDEILIPFLDDAARVDRPPYIILTAATRYCPTKFSNHALDVISTTRPTLIKFRIMSAWLDSGLEPEDIRPSVKAWLDAGYATSLEAEFIYKSWMDATVGTRRMGVTRAQAARRELAFLEPYMRRWIEHEDQGKTQFSARFVLDAWLNAAEAAGKRYAEKALDELLDRVDRYLEIYRGTLETAFVLYPALRASAKAGPAAAHRTLLRYSKYIPSWLTNDRSFTSEAKWVYSGLLIASRGIPTDAQATLASLDPVLTKWVASNGNDEDAVYLYCDWLYAASSAGADHAEALLSKLWTPLISWLSTKERFKTPQAEFIYSAWLTAASRLSMDMAMRTLDVLEPWIDLWNNETKRLVSDPRGHVRIPLRRTLILAGRPIALQGRYTEWQDEWWAFSRNLERFESEIEIDDGVELLSDLVDRFELPSELSDAQRRSSLNDIFIPTRYLAVAQEFRPCIAAVFFKAALHPSLFLQDTKCAAKLCVDHLDVLETLFNNAILSDDFKSMGPVCRLARFMLHLPFVEDESDAVSAKLSQLRHSYPDARIWDGSCTIGEI